MNEEWTQELSERLGDVLDAPIEVGNAALLAGGASQEAWTVDAASPEGQFGLIVRRAAGGAIYSHALSFEQEYRILQAAHELGVKVPKPYGRLDDLSGSEALVMQRLDGEGDGYQVTQNPEFEASREALAGQMAEELAKIHAVPLERLPSLPGASSEPAAPRILEDLEGELDLLEEPHPAIELGLH